MLIVPRLMRAVVRLHSDETTVVAAVGLCFAFALLARQMGYSVALGAFLAGALVAESGAAKIIEHRIEPVRDVFAAVFFVSVGMLIDPQLVWAAPGRGAGADRWSSSVGKLIGVAVGAFIAGYGMRTSVQAGMSLGQIGEFSFIIAGVGLSLGVTRHFLYPVAVAVSALTTLLTPWLIRVVGRASPRFVDRPAAAHAADLRGAVRRLGATGCARRPSTAPPGRASAAWCLLLVVDVALLRGDRHRRARWRRAAAARWAGDVARLGPRSRGVVLVGATVALHRLRSCWAPMRIARALGVGAGGRGAARAGGRRARAGSGGGAAARAAGDAADRDPAGRRRARSSRSRSRSCRGVEGMVLAVRKYMQPSQART